MRVLRVYHGGRNALHRARERALKTAGVDVTLVVPASWHDDGAETELSAETFPLVQLATRRERDVNRHEYRDPASLRGVLRELQPAVLDIHEEPFSVASRQWLAAADPETHIVMYTAQNVDKRFPPPFARYELAAFSRVAALYPCTAQAASVARGKGFSGLVDVLPLGYDDNLFTPGNQAIDDELVLGFFGRLVPEKGIADAVAILAKLHAIRPTRLLIAGAGPEARNALDLAKRLRVLDRVEHRPWLFGDELAAAYRSVHVVLVPSRPTCTWVEQFGRVIVEAQASGAVVAGYESGSIREVAGEEAILVGVGDVPRLVRRLVRVASDPSDYLRRRDAGFVLSTNRTWIRVAERQAALYAKVIAGEVTHLRLPSSPRLRRKMARSEFGPTAMTSAGARPFALPLLRRRGVHSLALAMTLDMAAERKARTHKRR